MMGRLRCPKCFRSDFTVQLPAAFKWGGDARYPTEKDLASCEHPLEDMALVQCNVEGCEWTGVVHELTTSSSKLEYLVGRAHIWLSATGATAESKNLGRKLREECDKVLNVLREAEHRLMLIEDAVDGWSTLDDGSKGDTELAHEYGARLEMVQQACPWDDTNESGVWYFRREEK